MQSIIKPLWLLVPASYPFCPPVVLDKMPLEVRLEIMMVLFYLYFYAIIHLILSSNVVKFVTKELFDWPKKRQ